MFAVVAALLAAIAAPGEGRAAPLRVCATTPDLGSLVREIGGEEVEVTVFAKPTEDPHYVEAKPSFVKALNEADLYVQNGLELEKGWAPVLLQQARNAAVAPGGPGYVDASTAIAPVQVPTGIVDRSMGDLHPLGNPHYLLDPLNGLKVAALLRDALIAQRPAQADVFRRRYDDFARRVHGALVGDALARKYDAEKLAILAEHGTLGSFLGEQGDAALLGGWLERLQAYQGTTAVADHNLWPYFARRFGLVIADYLEPKPGVPPTTRHLQEVIDRMRAAKIPLILAAVYYDPRHADFVAEQTGAVVVRMANQVGARPGTGDYLAMIGYDVERVAAALAGRL